jgi:hypothetical protein
MWAHRVARSVHCVAIREWCILFANGAAGSQTLADEGDEMQTQWQQAEGQRHILAADSVRLIEPGTPVRTMCGRRVTPYESDIPELGGNWFDRTCLDCEAAWFAADAANGGQS